MLNQKGFAVLDLQRLLEGIRNNWLIFTGSLVLFMAVAYLYIKFATPLYQVGLSMLIDTSGKSRKLGESMIVGGDVGLIETEKNLFNEIAVIKSYQLIERTVSELNFDVTYHTQQGLEDVEHFSYFPFKVKLLESHQHLYGIPFYVELLPERRYRLEVNAKDFVIYNSETRMNFMVEESLEISNIYSFGVNVKHDYFHFVLEEPDFEVNADHFSDDRIYFKIHSTDAVTKSYLNRIDVTQAGLDASIIELKSTGPVVKKEAEFLERLCQNYIDSKLERRDEIASSKEYFIEKQLAAVADSLARAERTLEAFKRRSNAVNLSQVATNALTQVQRLQTEEAKLQLNLKYYNSQLENLNLHDHEMLTAPSVVGIEDAMLNENLLELKRLYANRTRENLIRGEQSLDIEIIDNQIENSTRSLERTLRNLVESTNMSINDLRTRIGSMDSFISELPQSQKRLLSIERKRTLYENLFNYLSQELAKAGIARAEDIPDTRILDRARMVGNGPISPKKKLILLLATLLGTSIPLGWLILKDALNDTIDDVSELEANSNIPIVATIAQQSSGPLLSKTRLSKWRLDESFRDLSVNLHHLNANSPNSHSSVIGITSTIPGEGKSFCATNLAMHLSRNKKKVILIDADFRKPGLLAVSKGKKGFSSYLLEPQVPLGAVIHKWESFPGLDYIPSEIENERIGEILSSERLSLAIDELGNRYDYIIIDSPAAGVVSDYLLLANLIDVHLFVFRKNYSRLSFLSNLKKFTDQNNEAKIYLVFNGEKDREFKYGYAKYYSESSEKQVGRRNPLSKGLDLANTFRDKLTAVQGKILNGTIYELKDKEDGIEPDEKLTKEVTMKNTKENAKPKSS